MADFTARWKAGERPRVEDYLNLASLSRAAERVELIYREFCLAEWAGLGPRPEDYLARFPEHAEALQGLFRVDDVFGSSGLRLWEGLPVAVLLPEVGNEIGPYRLIRELGRGGFARVFLAEQSDLDDRLVVLKVSNRVTPEPALLARASHPHIVEVLWHGEAEDGTLQLICMPFLGGATLSAVLAERRRRGTRPGSGHDLLVDLDRVSADGYLPSSAGRPARELISRHSYSRASAWVVARLAEALDFAYSRGVLHGDVKPSNVLLTADGVPMLLDFNLSIGWWPHGSEKSFPGGTGGTLAYMAPERLRTVTEPALGHRPTPAARHRADIYSLGVLLLEMLTGRAPEPPASRPLSLQELANYYVSSRERGGKLMIRSARTPLPAGLRSVLARCLASDPVDRYRQASELAEDLDRWLSDRRLLFAREPGPTLGLLRLARRQKLALAFTALASVLVGGVVFLHNAVTDSRVRAEDNLRRVTDEALDSFPVRRPGVEGIRMQGNPAEVARRILDRYRVLDSDVNWRQGENFRGLPQFERNELEALLLEQALRFTHALSERPTEADWRRALISLEPLAASAPFDPLLAQCRELRRQLGEPETPRGRVAPSSGVPPLWMVEYLYGVEAELGDDFDGALDHYEKVLSVRPRSFWGNYRTAAVDCGKGRYHEAAKRLKTCVDQCPDNPALRRHYAGCLFWDEQYQEALAQCDKAQYLDPDHPEPYLTRSFLRLQLKQFQSFIGDINLYDTLTGHHRHEPSGAHTLDLTRTAPGLGIDTEVPEKSLRPILAFDAEGILLRYRLARNLSKAGRHDLAHEQYDRILEMNPDELTARYNRAGQRVSLGRDDVDEDYDFVASHPQVESVVRKVPEGFRVIYHSAMSLVRRGKVQEAIQIARTGVRIADRYEVKQVESYYVLARVYALAAKTDPDFDRDALECLRRAFQLSPRSIKNWYRGEPAFEDIRTKYGMSPFEAL